MTRVLFSAALALFAISGCGKKPEAKKPVDPPADPTPSNPTPVPGSLPPKTGLPAVDRQAANRDLKQLGLAYHLYCDDKGKAPGKAADLLPYVDNNQKLIGNVESGYYVMYFGQLPQQMTNGTANTVLGHAWDVPTSGGVTLFADGSTKNVSKDDFAAAPKAGK